MLPSDLQDEILSFAQEIVRLPSLPGQEGAVAQAVERKMRSLGYEKIQIDELGNVIGWRSGSQPGHTVLFDAHMDVVEAGDPQAWSSPPFAAELRDGRLWGRGASDMKGPLAAALVALGRLPAERFAGHIAFSASVGEEVHEGAAIARVMEAVQPNCVVICEPNGATLGLGHKGRAGLWVETYGKPAHSSAPHLGENAVYKATGVIQRLRDLPAPHDELLGEGVLELIEAVSSPYPSLATIPERFRMYYDRRLVRGETAESVLVSLRQALQGLEGWDLGLRQVALSTYTGDSLQLPDFHPAWAIARESPWVQKAARGLAEAGLEVRYSTSLFCTNGSYSAGTASVPSLIFGPSSGMLAHCVDEYITLDELRQGARGYWGLGRELGRAV